MTILIHKKGLDFMDFLILPFRETIFKNEFFLFPLSFLFIISMNVCGF